MAVDTPCRCQVASELYFPRATLIRCFGRERFRCSVLMATRCGSLDGYVGVWIEMVLMLIASVWRVQRSASEADRGSTPWRMVVIVMCMAAHSVTNGQTPAGVAFEAGFSKGRGELKKLCTEQPPANPPANSCSRWTGSLKAEGDPYSNWRSPLHAWSRRMLSCITSTFRGDCTMALTSGRPGLSNALHKSSELRPGARIHDENLASTSHSCSSPSIASSSYSAHYPASASSKAGIEAMISCEQLQRIASISAKPTTPQSPSSYHILWRHTCLLRREWMTFLTADGGSDLPHTRFETCRTTR